MLFIGGTGTISAGIVRKLVNDGKWEVWLLNRGNRKRVIPKGVHTVTADINDDFAIGYTALMGNPHAIGEAFQITGDEILSWNQIYKTVADALGVTLKPYYVSSRFLSDVGKKNGYDFEGSLIGDKAVSVVFDNSKLKRYAPDMTTHIPFSEGVRIALKYILEHPEECQKPDPEFDKFCDDVIDALEEAKKKF